MAASLLPALADDDLGTDVALTDDLPGVWGLASGKANLGMSLYRRFTTTRGSLFYDLDYGFNLLDVLNAEMSPTLVSDARGSCIAEAEKDDRVQAATVSLAFDPAAKQATFAFQIESALGPFDLVLRATDMTVDILRIAGRDVTPANAAAPSTTTVIHTQNIVPAAAPAAPAAPASSDQVFDAKVMRAGVAGSTSFNTADLVYPWGVAGPVGGWGAGGGATAPTDVLHAYPHVFPIDVVIKDLLISNQISGSPGAWVGRYKIGIYANLGPGLVYPATRLWEQSEVNPLPSGILTCSPNLAVAAGTLLWIVHTSDNQPYAVNLAAMGSNSATELMGFSGDLTTNPLVGWQMARTYDGTLPATFPTGTPTKLVAQSNNMPAFFMRFR
jgi:hypothetical protein